MNEQLKISFVDVETSLKKSQHFQTRKVTIPWDCVEEDTKILTWAAKDLYTGEIEHDSCHYHAGNKRSITTDLQVTKSLLKHLNKCDIVVWHYGNGFDHPIIKSRQMQLGLKAPKPFKSVDTLVGAAGIGFTSKKLDALGHYLGVGRKVPHSGLQLWKDYQRGVKEAQEKMVEYNIGDVDLLKDVYLKLLPTMMNHPNLSVMLEERVCSQCGQPDIKETKGQYMYYSKKYALHECNTCGAHLIETKDDVMRVVK